MDSEERDGVSRLEKILCKEETLEQRQEEEEKPGKDLGVEVMLSDHRDSGDWALESLDFISNAVKKPLDGCFKQRELG